MGRPYPRTMSYVPSNGQKERVVKRVYGAVTPGILVSDRATDIEIQGQVLDFMKLQKMTSDHTVFYLT